MSLTFRGSELPNNYPTTLPTSWTFEVVLAPYVSYRITVVSDNSWLPIPVI